MISRLPERPPYITFSIGTQEDRAASIEQGRHIARDVEMVQIMPAGSKDTVDREVGPWLADIEARARANPPTYDPAWAAHFRASYEAWKKGQEMPINGTPIRSWALLSPAQVQNLVSAHVLTIEDLAQANEQLLQQIGMGGRDLKNKAVAHLEQSVTGVAVARIAALEAKVDDLERSNREKDEIISRLNRDLDERDAKPAPAARRGAPAVQ